MWIFRSIWEGIRGSINVILPSRFRSSSWQKSLREAVDKAAPDLPAVDKKGPSLVWVVILWILHFIFIALILVALYYVNSWFDLERVLYSPWPLLKKVWLPLLFLLLYCLAWMGAWILRLLGPDHVAIEFPDIEACWRDALKGLRATGLEPADVPLYVILGQPLGGTDALFQAAQLQTRQFVGRADPAIEVHANRQGIFVTCPRACLLSRFAVLLGGLEEKAKLRGPEPEPAPPSSEKGPDLSLPGAAAPGAEAAAQTAVLEAPAPAAESQSARKRALLLKNHEEVERLTARLKYLCRIISKERRPYCATNGILCLLPFAAAENDANASQAGMILKQDLAAAREALQVHCPVYVMVCDLETEPGFRDFVPKLNAEQRRQATGQPFPLQPDIVATDFPVLLEAGVRWLADVQLPSQVYRHFGVETGEQKAEEATDANSRLYHLVSNVRERQRRLTRILGRSVLDQEPPLFGGCFVGGTGVDANREQAFVNGVFRTMLENQNYVSWTKDALSENADYLRWTRIGYLTIFLVAATVLALAIFHWWRPAWPF